MIFLSIREVALTVSQFIKEFWPAILAALFFFWPFLVYLQDMISGKPKRVAQKKELEQLSASLNSRETALLSKERTLSVREQNINALVRERTIGLACNIASREYLKNTPTFQALHDGDASSYDRLRPVLSHSLSVAAPFNISAKIHSSSGRSYDTSLYNCTCQDFLHHKKPCKHMLRLAAEVGLLLNLNTDPIENHISGLISERDKLSLEIEQLHRDEEKLLKHQADFDCLLKEKQQTYPWLAKLYADLFQTYDERWVNYLRHKSRPAHEKASEVEKIIKDELYHWRTVAKQAEHQLHFYESLFPQLHEFKEIPPLDAFSYVNTANSAPLEDQELLKKYLSVKEYATLSSSERYQLALDREIFRQKSSWEVGIEYERYIGYLCESKHYTVEYVGATMKLEDMGRDLILHNDSSTVLIQCKRWSQEKTIHEKHIFQLAGSVYEYRYAHPDRKVSGAFVTTTSFSPVAIQCAERLGIQLLPNIPFQDYPRIKCNIGKAPDGEIKKIYHLPMDQQYDNVKIDVPGEFYAWTVREAEEAGFRRAYRWRGSNK